MMLAFEVYASDVLEAVTRRTANGGVARQVCRDNLAAIYTGYLSTKPVENIVEAIVTTPKA